MAYYHLSFDHTLEGIWQPRVPFGSGEPLGLFSEPDTPRICLAPTIEQCFQAIYPNISKYFEVLNQEFMLMYLYSPETLKGLIPNEEVREWVQDAHVTEEIWLTEENQINLIGEIKILPSTLKYPDLMYLPFDKPGEKYYIAPKAIDYDLVLY